MKKYLLAVPFIFAVACVPVSQTLAEWIWLDTGHGVTHTALNTDKITYISSHRDNYENTCEAKIHGLGSVTPEVLLSAYTPTNAECAILVSAYTVELLGETPTRTVLAPGTDPEIADPVIIGPPVIVPAPDYDLELGDPL